MSEKRKKNMPKTHVLEDNKMRSRPMGRLLFGMALPLALSMLVQALYNIVDSIYVSQISTEAVTCLSLAFPIQNLQIGFATGIAVGMNSLLSKSLGEGNRERANRAAGNGIFLMLVAVALFMLFGAFGARPFYAMQTDVEDVVNGGTAYTSICCLLTLGIFVEVMGERLLQASGRTIYTLFTQGTGAILNILLDPLFIFGFEPLGIPAMGIAGAAVATVIGQWVAAIMAVIFNMTRNPDVQFGLKFLRPNGEISRIILSVGIPSVLMMAIGSVMNFGMNQILLGFGAIGLVGSAVFGLYFKLQSFVFMPVFGLNNACISIIAYNFGARQPKRITGAIRLTLFAALTIMLLGMALFLLIPETLMGFFASENQADAKALVEMGSVALRTICLSFPLAAVGIALSASFQSLGVGIYSTISSLCRQLVVLLPVAWLLSLTGQVNNVWWAFPIAEVFSLAVILFLYRRIYKNKVKPLYETN